MHFIYSVIYSMMLMVASLASFSCVNHNNDYLKQDQNSPELILPVGTPAIKKEPYFEVPASHATSIKPASIVPPILTQ